MTSSHRLFNKDEIADFLMTRQRYFLRWAEKMNIPSCDADDLFGELCLRALKAEIRGQSLDDLGKHLRVSFRNLIYTLFKGNSYSRHNVTEAKLPQEDFLLSQESQELSAIESLVLKERTAAVHDVLMQIAPVHRAYLEGTYFNGLSRIDLGKLSGRKAQASRSELFRARQAFQQRYPLELVYVN